MKNIQLITLDKYNDRSKFEKVEEGIYKALFNYNDNIVKNGNYVTAFSFTLEEDLNETGDIQYPLEDLLDKYLAHVSEFIQYETGNPVMKLELCTKGLDRMRALITIVDKHVFNRQVIKDGETYVELVIE